MIGESLPRPDAIGKVTGATAYPGDLVRADMAQLAVVYAGRPHARIRRIDTGAARALPGVLAVLTAADVPFNRFGLIEADAPVLCDDVVRYVGDRVALVVADDATTARAAAALVHIDYDDLPIVADVHAALAPTAPQLHPHRPDNIVHRLQIRRGDVARGFAEADVVLSETFRTSWQEHAFLQPEAGVAWVDDDDRVVIETAGQWLHEDRRQIAAMLRLPESRVVVRYAAIGGAFGGREDLGVQHLLALAAWVCRRRVALVWRRDESMMTRHKRHPFTIETRWGARRDGTITAVEARLLADGGAYASTSQEVVKIATLFATGCYEVANVALEGVAVYTNNVPSGAFRGFGSPQAQFASESMVTRLAHALGIDSVEMRRRNLYREGSIEPSGEPLPPGVSVRACLDAVVAELARQPPSAPPAGWRRGRGVACGIKNVGYSFGYPEQATATVELSGAVAIERAVVRTGVADVGQGSHLAMRQIAATALGLTLGQVHLISDDSAETPDAGSASASRLTLVAGRAVHDAALAALARWHDEERPACATVQFRPRATTPLAAADGAGRPNYCYGYTAQALEVDVDPATGECRVVTIISAHDVGRAINRQQVVGQIEGALAQALGYALMEEFQMRDGQVRTAGFSTYLLPTALDMAPRIIPLILEHADDQGPFGARGMSEMPLVPFAPALAAAIHDATGAWLSRQPMTPERVRMALRRATASEEQS